MGPIVLHSCKKLEDPWSRFEEMAKKHHTDGWNDRLNDGQTWVNS